MWKSSFIGILKQREFKTAVRIVSKKEGNYKERERETGRERESERDKVNSFASKYTYN